MLNFWNLFNLNSIVQTILVAIIGLLFPFLTGCSVADTGPNVVRQALTTTGGIAQSTISAFQPETTQVGAKANVTNPAYDFYTFIGSGAFVWTKAAVTGVSVDGQLMSSGRGVEIPEAVRLEAARIINSDLPPDVKSERMTKLWMDFAKSYRPFAPAPGQMTEATTQ